MPQGGATVSPKSERASLAFPDFRETAESAGGAYFFRLILMMPSRQTMKLL